MQQHWTAIQTWTCIDVLFKLTYFSPFAVSLKFRGTLQYEKAATELQHHDPPIILAKVDSNEEFNKGLATKYEVKGFPTMKIIKNQGQQVLDYKGPREAGGMVTYLLKMAGPPSILLSSMEQAAVFLKEQKLAVVWPNYSEN